MGHRLSQGPAIPALLCWLIPVSNGPYVFSLGGSHHRWPSGCSHFAYRLKGSSGQRPWLFLCSIGQGSLSYLLGESNNLEPMNVLPIFGLQSTLQNKAQTPSNQNSRVIWVGKCMAILTDLPRIIHLLGWEYNDPFFGDDIFRDGDSARSFFKDL